VPEDNTLWYLAVHEVGVIDCVGDSLIADEPVALGSIDDACACPEDRRIYTGWSERILAVNMDKPAEVDTLHARMPGFSGMRFLNIPGAHKAYWAVSNSGVSTHLFIIDTRTSTLVDSLWVQPYVSDMCLDHTGKFVYCVASNQFDTTAIVIDPRSDSVVARFMLPPMIAAEKDALVPNCATNRIYVAQSAVYTYGNEIPVIRDSMLVGLHELGAASTPVRLGEPTILRRGTPLRASRDAALWDATGRRASVLSVGLNSTERLAPGVYFMREEPSATRYASQAIRKVVVAR
jgi:hypothetical protein